MSGRNTAVMGIFAGRAAADNAVERLKEAGFRSTDVSVLIAENTGSKDFVHQKDSKAPEGTTVGASTGAVIGGSVGWLAGVGALSWSGLAPLAAAGPIMATLAGIGVGGSIGAVIGACVGLRVPEYEARRFEGCIHAGKALLSVHCDDRRRIGLAKLIMVKAGGGGVAARREAVASPAWATV